MPPGLPHASGLGLWLHSRFPQQRVSAGLVTADVVGPDDLLTATGRLTATAHRAGHESVPVRGISIETRGPAVAAKGPNPRTKTTCALPASLTHCAGEP